MLDFCSLMVEATAMGKVNVISIQNNILKIIIPNLNLRIPKPNDNFVELTSLFAVSTGSIAADLQQIPNQPTVFVVYSYFIFEIFIFLLSTYKINNYRKIQNKKIDMKMLLLVIDLFLCHFCNFFFIQKIKYPLKHGHGKIF